MKRLILLILILSLPLSVIANPFSAPTDLKIAAFNIRIFGKSKMKKPEVVKNLVKIVRRYDIIVIQEVRDKSGTAIKKLLEKVNENNSDAYELIISDRIGRSSMKEQYAFLYRPSKLEVLSQYQYTDKGLKSDEFHREPYIVRFKASNGFDFSLIAIHTDPDIAVKEINNLTKVYDDSVSKWGEIDALILGDFNADCKYVKHNKWGSISLWTDNRFKWLIDNLADTTVKGSTDCAYDRIVATGEMKNSAIEAKVFYFDTEYGLTPDFAYSVSDHYPIEVKIN